MKVTLLSLTSNRDKDLVYDLLEQQYNSEHHFVRSEDGIMVLISSFMTLNDFVLVISQYIVQF